MCAATLVQLHCLKLKVYFDLNDGIWIQAPWIVSSPEGNNAGAISNVDVAAALQLLLRYSKAL
jgi:hypothetical protein